VFAWFANADNAETVAFSATLFCVWLSAFWSFRIPRQTPGLFLALVLIAMNQNGMQDMLKSKFKLGADAAASAGPVGRNAQAGTDWKLNSEFLTYSRSKGLFAGLDLDGTVLSQSDDDTRAEYGTAIPFETILKGNQPVPDNAKPFVRTVARYFVSAKADNASSSKR